MADTVIIPLSVQFKDAVQNFKSLVEQYQKELDKLTPGTSIYKSIEAQLKQAMALVKRTDLQANIGVSKESQITKMTSDLEAVQHILGNVKEAFSNLGFKDLNLGHGSFEQFKNDVKTIENEINSLNAKKQELENLSVAGALNKAGLDKKGFNKGDLDKGVIQYYNEVTAAIQKAEQAIVKLQEQQKLLNTSITANQSTMDQTKDAHFLNNLYNSFGMSNLKMDKVSSTYSNMLTEQYNAGTLGSVHVQNALKMIGLDDATISMLQSSGADAAQKFQEVLANLNQTKMQKSVSGYLKENYGGAQGMKNEAKAYDNANKQLLTNNAKLGEIASKIKTQENAVKRYTVRRDKISGVTKEYSDLQNNLNTLSQRVTTLEQQVASSVGKGLGTGNVPPGDQQASAGIAKNEAQQQMGSAIDNMARRWIGTYAIVNKVRQAIRQAWNDIKNLDQAMTNIAVVTSMSVDQLWGQIDQYMSIAQQYGVTTQGVYEVSQIFYQQGLGTSDVMAATTETLKMARIAGMDYKEAADAMTVAIRAFKMEMTDAAHVTDVYSKVASITASDSNELATAMSKTASSAENVGSSFENTTAMLAVMIETTRESAQNLGSALKSIISRYGEMKVGLTKDSEGEEIDYNKVDTALKSVGISIKDARGQFRDFDDVIFELSKKWDTLDKNTQRYIATIMAGNRQQSRFIALVDNWERLDEISDAANNDADDAGLIQYSKTLDSLDAKINNLKNSFQQLYMGIADGAAFKGFLTTLNEIITGFSNMGSGLLVALPGIIAGFRALFAFIKAGVTKYGSDAYVTAKGFTNLILADKKAAIQEEITYAIMKNKEGEAQQTIDTQAGAEQRENIETITAEQIKQMAIAKHAQGEVAKTGTTNNQVMLRSSAEASAAANRAAGIVSSPYYNKYLQKGMTPDQAFNKAGIKYDKQQKKAQLVNSRGYAMASMGLSLGGMALSTYGAQLTGSGNYQAGAVASLAGNAASGAGMGAMFGPWGMAIGGILGALSSLPNVLKEFSHNVKLERDYEKAKKEAEEANLKRAEAQNEASSFETLVQKVQDTSEFKNDDEESYQQWVDANNALVEKYPEMLGYIDEYGNSIANLTNSTELLSQKMLNAAKASSEYYTKQAGEIEAEKKKYNENTTSIVRTWTSDKEENPLQQFIDYLYDEGKTDRFKIRAGDMGFDTTRFARHQKNGTFTSELSSPNLFLEDIINYFQKEKNINISEVLTKASALGYWESPISPVSFWPTELVYKDYPDFTEEELVLLTLLDTTYIKKDEKGNLVIDDSLQGALKTGEMEERLASLRRGAVQHSINAASTLTEYDDPLANMLGYTSLLTHYATSKGYSDATLLTLYDNIDVYEELIKDFAVFFDKLSINDREILNNLYDEIDNISLQYLQESLIKMGTPEDIIKAYEKEWYNSNYSSKAFLIKATDNDFFTSFSKDNYDEKFDKDFKIRHSLDEIRSLNSYAEWLSYTGKGASAESKEEYYLLVEEVIKTSSDELVNFYLKSTNSIGESYIKALRSQTKIINAGGLAGDAAKDRLSKVQKILQEIYSKDFLTEYGLPEDFNIEEYAKLLLADNIGSQEWAKNLEEFEKKYNLNLADFNEYVFENFGTYLAQTTENMNSAIKDFKNISEVQSKGIDDFEKALKYYEDYADDLAWDDFYTWTEDGKLIFKNIDQVFSQIGNDVIEVSKQYNQALEAITLNGTTKNLDSLRLYKGDFYTSDQLISSLNTKEKPTLESLYSDMDRIGIFSKDVYDEVAAWWDWTGEWNEQDIKELETILAKSDLKTLYNRYKEGLIEIEDLVEPLRSFGFTEEQIGFIQSWLATEGKDASYDELLAYLQEQADLLNAQSEYYIQQRKSLAKQARQLTFSTAVEGDIKEYNDKQLVGQIIQSGNEFTKEQLQSIGNNLDATYDEVAEIFSLQYDSSKNVWVQKEGLNLDASKTLIQDKVDEATQAYEDAKKADSGKTENEIAALELEKERWELIQTYFDGTDDIYTRLFDSSSKWKEINNSIKTYNKKQIFSDGKIDLNELKTLSENEEILTNLLDKGILTWNDALQSFELTQTLTDEQKAILETAGIDPNTWTNFVSKQMKSWQEQAEEIISKGGKNLTAKDIEILKKDGYNLEISEGESLSLSQYKTLADANDATAAVYLEQQSKEVSNKLLEIVLKPAEVTLEDLINLGETIGGEGSINTEGYIAAIEAAKEGNFDAINGIVEELLQAADGILDISADSLNAQKTINKNEVSSSIQDSLSSAYSDLTNVSLSSLTELWKTVYSKTEIDSGTVNSYEDAIKAAEQGETKALINILQQLTQTAIQQGYDIDTSALEAAYKDAANSLIQSLISMLEAGVSGTLSATDMLSLAEKTGINIQQYTTNTIDGYKLSTEGLLQVGSYLEKTYGSVYNVAEKLVDSFVGEGMTYSGVEDLLAAAEGLEKVEGKVTEQYESQYKLLTKMANISRLNPDDPLFNFMDQESTRGMANGFDNMVSSIDAVKSAFSSIKSGDIIDNDTFYNMMDYMHKSKAEGVSDRDWLNTLGFNNKTIDNLIAQEKLTFNTYDDFVKAMISSSKELGGIDGEVLMNMGFSMKNAANSMSSSLKEVANNQIEFLEGIKKTLESMKELEDIGEISLGTFTLTSGETVDILLKNYKVYLDKLDPNQKQKLQESIISKFSEGGQLELSDEIYKKVFGENGFSLDDKNDTLFLDKLLNYDLFNPEQWQAFALQYPELVKEQGGIDWDKVALMLMDGFDPESFEGLSTSAIAAAQASIEQAEIAGITYDASNFTFTFDSTKEGANWKNAVEQMKEHYKKQGLDVEFSLEGQKVKVHYIDPKVSVVVDKFEQQEGVENFIFDTANETYTGQITIDETPVKVIIDKFGKPQFFDSENNPLNGSTNSELNEWLKANGFETTLAEDGSIATITIAVPEDSVDYTQQMAENVAAIKDMLNAGIDIAVTGDAETVIDGLLAAYVQLEEYIAAHPLSINSSGGGSIVINGSTPQNGEDGEDSTAEPLTQPIKLEWDKESLNGWKQENLKQEVDLDYNINTPSLSTLTRKVRLDYDSASADLTVTVHDGASGATGNVALAMGHLMTGAALARGTLMGELGPELYVQNGQYHIAGANGPEFVDLAPDAIVFNHLQTAGLLNKGHISSKGSPVTSEKHSVGAYATGNVSGIALASGIDGAIEAIDRAIAQWKQIAKLSAKELLDASGGGGGGGNSIKAVTQELQEWYNLLRKIEKLEKDINLLQTERNNLAKGDGAARLRSMRQEQQLLREQAATQAVLLDYQRLQLDRQKNEINNPDSIWSQFLEVGPDGLLQYKKGNEINGGKGALEVLQELNEMSGEDQIKFLGDLGYTYTTADGEELKDSKLVEQFYKELQEQIDQYDTLYDTVREAEVALENYTNEVNELEEEIRQNKLDLEQSIYDIIVEAWKKEIELLEEQSELIKEANNTYINGIREAVNTEKELYDQNQKIEDRESLQRQLSLLRRSGGSASEIANLEKQLDNMLKDEYFEHQNDMIENIQEANDKQIKLLEQQIKIQQESLEYQQEHGIIWEEVVHIMSLSRQEILDFMQGTDSGFFKKSAEQQYDTLMDWSEKVGIFTEDRKLDQYAAEGIANYFDNGNIWDDSSIANYQSTFNSMSKSAQGSIRTMFGEAYAQAINEGQDSTNARNAGIAAITPWLNGTYDAEQAEKYNEPTRPTGGDAKDWRYVVGGSLHLRDSASTSGKSLGTHPTGTKVKVLQDLGDWCKVEVNGQTGYMMSKYLEKRNESSSSAETGASKYRAYYNVVDSAGKVLRSNAYGAGSSESQARNNAYYMGNKWMKENNKTGTVKITKVSAYSQGGLVDYTGLAMVHGSKKKPESFLNAEQTARITDALKAQQNMNPLKETLSRLQNAINLLGENIRSIIIPSANQANNINIASGAITISVQELNDSYDIDEVVNDIQGRILSIAAKSTNRSVNRR